jgi:hypothetical protein
VLSSVHEPPTSTVRRAAEPDQASPTRPNHNTRINTPRTWSRSRSPTLCVPEMVSWLFMRHCCVEAWRGDLGGAGPLAHDRRAHRCPARERDSPSNVARSDAAPHALAPALCLEEVGPRPVMRALPGHRESNILVAASRELHGHRCIERSRISARPTRSTRGVRRGQLNREDGVAGEAARPGADSKITSRWLNATVPLNGPVGRQPQCPSEQRSAGETWYGGVGMVRKLGR